MLQRSTISAEPPHPLGPHTSSFTTSDSSRLVSALNSTRTCTPRNTGQPTHFRSECRRQACEQLAGRAGMFAFMQAGEGAGKGAGMQAGRAGPRMRTCASLRAASSPQSGTHRSSSGSLAAPASRHLKGNSPVLEMVKPLASCLPTSRRWKATVCSGGATTGCR